MTILRVDGILADSGTVNIESIVNITDSTGANVITTGALNITGGISTGGSSFLRDTSIVNTFAVGEVISPGDPDPDEFGNTILIADTLNGVGIGYNITNPLGICQVRSGTGANGIPTAWDFNYMVITSNVTSSGINSSGLGLSYAFSGGLGSIITSIAPNDSWKPLSLFALNHSFYISGNKQLTISSTGNLFESSTGVDILNIGTSVSGTPSIIGSCIDAKGYTFNDSNTSASGTASNMVFNSFGAPLMTATNTLVTTTNAATVYIADSPTASTNQTITNAYSLWVDSGTSRFDGKVGISTGIPTSSLQVAGAIENNPSTTGVHIGLSGTNAAIELCSPSGSVSYIDFTQTSTDFNGRILYYNTTDLMEFYTGSVSRLLLDGSGNVGIGIAAPKGILDVNSSNGNQAIFRGTANDSSATSQFTSIAANVCLSPIQFNGSIYHYFRSGGINYKIITSGSTYLTGQHSGLPIDSYLKTNIQDYVGLIVISADEGYHSYNKDGTEKIGKDAICITDSLPKIKLSFKQNDKAVFGVISNHRDNNYNSDGTPDLDNTTIWGDSLYDHVRVNSLGEGAIWVSNKDGNLDNGDYITTCSIPGYGTKQSDDILHNYTVAKSTCSVNYSDLNALETKFQVRYIKSDGQEVSRSQYEDSSIGKNIAVFIGCTYHCG